MSPHNIGFVNLPDELLENILSSLGKPQDLLSLALCSRRFAAIIIPVHLCFRNIICSPTSTRLWDYLDQHRYTTSNIRGLHLVEDTSTVEPAHTPIHILEMVYQTTLESNNLYCRTLGIRVLILVLRFMRSLTRFTFFAKTEAMCQNFQYLCDALKYLPIELEEFNLIARPALWNLSSRLCPILMTNQLKALKSCTIYLHPSMHMPYFLDFLIYGTDLPLESFYFEWHNALKVVSASHLLQSVHWKLLRRITLVGDGTFYDRELSFEERGRMTQDFITRHEQLEAFKIVDTRTPYPQRFMPKSHPRLKSLSIGAFYSTMISDIIHQIEHVTGILDIRDGWTSLKSCDIRVRIPGGMSRIVERLPQLEKLSYHDQDFHTLDIEQRIEFIGWQLLNLKRMTYLTHLSAWTTASWGIYQEIIVEKLATTLPQLRYLEIPGAQWVSLQRDSKNKYLAYKTVENILDVSPQAWGGLFASSYLLKAQ